MSVIFLKCDASVVVQYFTHIRSTKSSRKDYFIYSGSCAVGCTFQCHLLILQLCDIGCPAWDVDTIYFLRDYYLYFPLSFLYDSFFLFKCRALCSSPLDFVPLLPVSNLQNRFEF